MLVLISLILSGFWFLTNFPRLGLIKVILSYLVLSYLCSIHLTFVGVAVVDGVEAVYCDSSNKILESRQDWVKKVFDNDSQLLEWYKHECFNIQPSAFRARIVSLKQQFNQSEGFYILQTRSGCEWEESTGEKFGFLKYGYNGEDFIELDLNTLSWASLKPEADTTKQSWDADRNRTKLNKVFLTDICPERLKSFLEFGNSSLQRTVPPSVSLLQKSSSSPVSCHATGFYPDRAVMFWRKDGEKVHEGVEIGDILPNDDGTFQMSVNLNVSSFTPEEWSRFDCVFQLSDVEKIIVTKLNKTLIRTNWKEKMTKETSGRSRLREGRGHLLRPVGLREGRQEKDMLWKRDRDE
uniref:Ig-like domain-containing protein n=1 Tax=Pundamilia nyererei TaxID=303518 RepID=A0A3B4FZC2_9CICH